MSDPAAPGAQEPASGAAGVARRGPTGGPTPTPARFARYAGLLAAVIAITVLIATFIAQPNGAKGVEVGRRLPPFAVPLALGRLGGDADIALRAHEGASGNVPACEERGAQVLNVCELYERGPVVVALFVDAGSCAQVLGDLQALAPSFPGVQFAAVALRPDRAHLRRLVLSRALRIPVGVDRDGALLALYKVATCPQVSFAYPGGIVQSPALLTRPALATLRARVAALAAAARARGWKGPGG